MTVRLYPDWPNPRECDAATGETILEALKDGKVLQVTRAASGNGFRLCEGCDEYFNLFLSSSQLFQLGTELCRMALDDLPRPVFPTPHQIAECGGPCTEGGPSACDCGLWDYTQKREAQLG